ncbi:hypothetical protein ACSBR2_028564 [Camellia fascicularis]
MAKSRDDIKYGTAQAKLSENEALPVRYKSGTPLEEGKIADSETGDLFSPAHNISDQNHNISDQSQLHPSYTNSGGSTTNTTTTTTG